MEIELPELLKKFLRPIKRTMELYLTHNSDYRRWYRKNVRKLSCFQDIHQGESCFIIGNGPSLNKMDLAPLRQRFTFGLNKIYLMFDKIDLNLSYHVATDPLVIEQSIRPFHELSCPTFICWRSGKDYFPNCEHVNFIRVDWHEGFTRDITKEIWDGGSVTYAAMQIAFYMGFSTVYLIGVDHTYDKVWSADRWDAIITDHDANHFDQNYYRRGQRWFPPELDRSELGYRIAKYVYEQSGRKILDATIGSNLKVFDKIPYEEALRKSTKRNDPRKSR